MYFQTRYSDLLEAVKNSNIKYDTLMFLHKFTYIHVKISSLVYLEIYLTCKLKIFLEMLDKTNIF